MLAEKVETPSDGGQQCPPVLEKWQERIKLALDPHKKRIAEFEKNRKYARGEMHDDGKGGLVRTNLIYTNQATIVPHVYAKNPEIAVSPSKAIGPNNYAMARKFAQTMDAVLHRMFVMDTQLKKRVRGSLYSVMNTGEGWLKMIYQRDHASDPVIKNRIHDAQDNLARLERLIRETEDEDKSHDVKRQRDEIMIMLDALQQQVEVAVAEGLVIDRILTDDILILDKTLVDFDMYSQADAIDHLIWMVKDEYCERFGDWPKEGAPTVYHERSLKDAHQHTDEKGKKTELVCVHELWHLRSNTVLTFADGAKYWAREPYSPTKQAERWYPFYRLGWNHLDGCHEALPDTSLQRELQDEYNASRTQWAAAREESMPVRVVRGSGALTQDDIDNIKNRKSRQIIVVDGKPGEPLNNDLGQIEGIPLNPAVYDTTPIRGDMEMVSGRGDASTGGIVEAKTATEAEIMQSGLASRSDYRRDVVEDAIEEMAIAAAQMLLQELTVPQVQYLAGSDAVWPMMAKPEVFQLINIEIRAGTTSKPNQQREREQWAELLPLMQETIGRIFELQKAGELQMANVLRALLKETLRRYDERLDLEELIGPEDETGQAQAQQMAVLHQQVQELQQALMQAQEQLAATDEAKMQTEQRAAEQRAHEMSLKERELEERRLERQAAKEEAERKAMETELAKRLQREETLELKNAELDREDYRAERDRQWEREKLGLEQRVEELQSMLTQLQSGTDPTAEMQSALQREIERIENTIAASESARQNRVDIIAEYLSGPRDEASLRETVDRLTAA